MKGKVIKYFPDKGFGFLKLEDGNDCYFHKSNIKEEIDHIYPGDVAEVEFRESRKKPGSFEAITLNIWPNQKKNPNPSTKIVEQYIFGRVKTSPTKGFGFVGTNHYGDVYFRTEQVIGQTPLSNGSIVLLDVIPSKSRPGNYEATFILSQDEISFGNLVSEQEGKISERNFKICIFILQSKYFFSKAHVTEDQISLFFSKLNPEQKYTALQLWLDSKLSYYDEVYFEESFDTMSQWDQLCAISVRENISHEIAFGKLGEDKKRRLFDELIAVSRSIDDQLALDIFKGAFRKPLNYKKQRYIDINYLRSMFEHCTFWDVFKVLILIGEKSNLVILLEFLENFPQNEYNDFELNAIQEILKKGSVIDKERAELLFSSIHPVLNYSQKLIILKAFTSSSFMLYDSKFLISEINQYSLSERIVLAEKVNQSTRSSIYESIIHLIEDGLTQPLMESIHLIKKFRSHNINDLSARLITAIADKITPDEKYELWKEGLIDDIDQDWLISNLSFADITELSKVLTRVDPSQYDKIIEATIHDYPEIKEIQTYNKVATALQELGKAYQRYRYPYEIIEKYRNELYDRSSQELKYRLFLDRLVNRVQLSMIKEDLKVYDSNKFARYVEALSPEERIEFSKIVLSMHIVDAEVIQYTHVISVIELFSNFSQLQFEVVNQILLIVNNDIKLKLMQDAFTSYLSDEMFKSRLEFLLEHAHLFSQKFNSYMVFYALSRNVTQEIANKFFKECTDFKGLLLTTFTLLNEGLCFFKSGHYSGVSIIDVWKTNSRYIKYIRRTSPWMLHEINKLASAGIKTIESVNQKVDKFIESKLIPNLANIRFESEFFLKDLVEINEIVSEINNRASHALSSCEGLNSVINKGIGSFIRTYHYRIQNEVQNIDSGNFLRDCGKTFYCLKAHFNKSSMSGLRNATYPSMELLESCSKEFLEEIQLQIKKLLGARETFQESLNVVESIIDDDENNIIHRKWLRDLFYESLDAVIISESREYETINSYKKWLKLRILIKELKPRTEILFPEYICPYIESLERIRAQTIRDFLRNGSIMSYTRPRFERAVALICEIKESYDDSQAKELINSIHSSTDGEFQLKLWLNEVVDVFDFERYAMVYFTLTREERRKFNKRVREIIKVELDKKLLAVRVPWGLVKREGNEPVYEATWKSVWFQDGAIRFCMDEGIFSAPYKVSYARKDFNSLYSFLSGKRGGELTIHCLNDTIVDVQGLDELKELIQRVIITRGLTEDTNFLFKSEGENRVPVNLLLKNECINVLSKLVGEGIKVHRVYEKIWKIEHGIQLPFNFDISYIFPVNISDGRYVLLWESARLEKSKATYVFSCPQDQLDEHLERIISYIDKRVNVRSAILTSTEVQSDLGFIGRIEHENFDIFPWKKRLVSYLPGYSDKIFESSEAEHQ